MAFAGYLDLGSVPLIDNELTHHLATEAGLGNVLLCPPCTIPDVGWRTRSVERPPWWDDAVPASKEFLGLSGLEMSGLTKPTRSRTVTALAHAGGSLGRLTAAHREIAVRATALATSDAGMSYGMGWLAWALAHVDAEHDGTSCGSCAGSTARLLAYCPTDPADESAWRTLYEVGLLDWDADPEIRRGAASCTHGRVVIGEVTFVLAAARPWLHGPQITLAEQLGFLTPTRWPCQGWVPHRPGQQGSPLDCAISVMDECIQWVPADEGFCRADSCNTTRSNVLDPVQSTGTGTTTQGWTLTSERRALIDADMSSPAAWTTVSSSTEDGVPATDPAAPRGLALEWTHRYDIQTTDVIGYDPRLLYETEVWLRSVEEPSDLDAKHYSGLMGHTADGAYCNARGEDTYGGQHYCTVGGRTIPVAGTYRHAAGYLKGHALAGENGTGGERPDANSPGVMHANVAAVRGLVFGLYEDLDGRSRVGGMTVTVTPNPGAKIELREGRAGIADGSAGVVVRWKHPTMPGWPVRPGHTVDFTAELAKLPYAQAQLVWMNDEGSVLSIYSTTPGESGKVSATAPEDASYVAPEVVVRSALEAWQPIGAAELLAQAPSTAPGSACDPNPYFGAPKPPPTLPVPGDTASCIATLTPAYATTQVPAGRAPAHAEMVPSIVIHAGAKPVRKLSIKIYRANGMLPCAPENLDECDLVATFGVPYLGAGTVLSLDGRAGCFTKICADGSVEDNVTIYNGNGRPLRELPTFSAAESWCVVAIADRGEIVDPEAVTATMSIMASPRWEAA
ncbi:hypothetical protein AB0J38_14405 [Streptomyces sp. NPDC050095]|uniref:hypothetical protein n=1 Tax=unclassified Streptomyces TaxID=2593676 RepID=UPI00342E7ABE